MEVKRCVLSRKDLQFKCLTEKKKKNEAQNIKYNAFLSRDKMYIKFIRHINILAYVEKEPE